MKQARALMVQGTASTVGKSTLVTGLCRIFAQEGWRVAPFKAQNMALNSFVVPSGGEIGRAQAVQAEAAGIEPTVDINPILLKPEGHSRSQVIVLGRPLTAMEARDYYRNRASLLTVVQQALARLQSAYDLLIIEGAGSPVELNLVHNDLVNMRVAHLADASVLLVGDIDRGGIFASLLGTLMLFPPQDRVRVKGLVVNKFRGDLSLWHEGEQLLAARSGIPVLGTIPYFKDIVIAEEDSVALEHGTAALLHPHHHPQHHQLEIVVVRLPYVSNYDEFDALATSPGVRVRFAADPAEFPSRPDLIILPGTKNTISDLAWLWRQGLAQHIRQLAKDGCAVLGICGGYQMLGERLSDPLGSEVEAGTVESGLHLLPVETFFASLSDKTTLQCQAHIEPTAAYGLFAHIGAQHFQAYQIHLGRTVAVQKGDVASRSAFTISTGGLDGWLSVDGWCAGCYLHGLFENDAFRQGVIEALAKRHPIGHISPESFRFNRQNEYDKLATHLRTHLDISHIKALLQLIR